MIVKVKALKDIELKGLKPIKAGTVFEAAKDYADKWIDAGKAELFAEDRKPIDIPKIIAKKEK